LLPTMWYLHTKLRFPNPKPGPDAQIQCWVTNQEAHRGNHKTL
jgi:hypothetical protein